MTKNILQLSMLFMSAFCGEAMGEKMEIRVEDEALYPCQQLYDECKKKPGVCGNFEPNSEAQQACQKVERVRDPDGKKAGCNTALTQTSKAWCEGDWR